jgi:cytochrome c-type biogenesis protein CcmH/NrfG
MGPVGIFARRPTAAREAVLRFSRLLRARSEDADAWHALGAASMALGDRASALAAFRNAVRLDPARPHTQLALGNLLFDCGHLDQALRCFELAGLPWPSPGI